MVRLVRRLFESAENRVTAQLKPMSTWLPLAREAFKFVGRS